MSRIIGCRDLYIATLSTDTIGGENPTYASPEKVPSLISLSISDSVEQSKFFSDDSVEQAFSRTASKEVTVELGYMSNELEGKITGKTYSAGVLTQKAGDAPKELALLFRAPKSKGGDFRYVCLCKGTLTRAEVEYTTQEEGVESSNVTLTGTFYPLLCNGALSIIADSDDESNEEVIRQWFTKVPGQAEVA